MPRNVVPHYIATGDINPARFVTANVALDFGVQESVATDDVVGISQAGAKAAPLGFYTPSTLAAASGDPLDVYGEGEECSLELGGTVTAGQVLKPTTAGKGIAATIGTDKIGAKALEAGVSGDIIRVVVRIDAP